MQYRGHEIDDNRDIQRWVTLDKFTLDWYNEREFTLDELDELRQVVIDKEHELEQMGVECPNVLIDITGSDYDTDDKSFTVQITWREPETEDEKKDRIRRAKESIDVMIENERQEAASKARQHEDKIREAMRTLEEAGFEIKHNKHDKHK